MKKIEDIIKQNPVYLKDWSSKIDVVGDFEEVYMDEEDYLATNSPYPNETAWLRRKDEMKKAIEKYRDISILFASYGNENYSGDAYVLYEKDGRLYEVSGGHCSCYGLEGQWEPEEVYLQELEHRLLHGTFGEDDCAGNSFKEDLCEFLGVEYRKNN